jgi:uncharacterized membrane protein YraQ (UPF0718 family)
MNNQNSEDLKLITWVIKVIVATLCIIVFASVTVLLGGLFSTDVSNDKIFEILGPALSTVIGSFVGLLGGMSINFKLKEKDKNV